MEFTPVWHISNRKNYTTFNTLKGVKCTFVSHILAVCQGICTRIFLQSFCYQKINIFHKHIVTCLQALIFKNNSLQVIIMFGLYLLRPLQLLGNLIYTHKDYKLSNNNKKSHLTFILIVQFIQIQNQCLNILFVLIEL